MMLKSPDWTKDENTLGIIKNGCMLEHIRSQNDPIGPSIKWYQVKILDGDLKGKQGWISVSVIWEKPEPPSEADIQAVDSIKKLRLPSHTLKTALALMRKPYFADVSDGNSIIDMAPPGTLLEVSGQPIIDKTQQSWVKVDVLSGDTKGKHGWMSADYVQRAFTIIGSKKTNVLGHSRAVSREGKFAPTSDDMDDMRKFPNDRKPTPWDYKVIKWIFTTFLEGDVTFGIIEKPTPADLLVIRWYASAFFGGKGNPEKNDEKSHLSRRIALTKEFIPVRDDIVRELDEILKKQCQSGYIDLRRIDLNNYLNSPGNLVRFPLSPRETPHILRALLGGTQGARIVAIEPSAICTIVEGGGGKVKLSFTLRYEIYDVFGANVSDMWNPGVAAMRMLQTLTPARPFTHVTYVDSKFEKEYQIPKDFKTSVNWLEKLLTD